MYFGKLFWNDLRNDSDNRLNMLETKYKIVLLVGVEYWKYAYLSEHEKIA